MKPLTNNSFRPTINVIFASTKWECTPFGTTLAAKLVAVGHEVLVANSRGPESLRARLAEIDVRITPASVTDASGCEVVLLAVPWTKIEEVLTPEQEWNGRILVDATNIFLSYSPDFRIADLNGDSGSEIGAFRSHCESVQHASH
ncbi:NADPH-dependent F420 reductase [Stieleria neptunia]|uniref:NADPH-dependent F420 reductase n=1 Tax=Stieleria neptunia TaxID=2527979 RepID=UPI00119D3F6F|nr:NAD(P)-binding domain-containing protein [Stieleria neptunia]